MKLTLSIFYMLYLISAEDNSERREEEEKRRLEIVHTFRTAPFEEIVARSEAKVSSNLKKKGHIEK